MQYRYIVILLVSVVVLALVYYATKSQPVKNKGEVMADESEKMIRHEQVEDPLHTIAPFDFQSGHAPVRGAQMNPVKHNTNVLPYPQISNNYAPQQANIQGQFGIDTGAQPKMDCFPKDTITPQELMPRDDSYNTWQMASPSVNGHLADRNFLESGYHFGIDTVSNTLKNPNLQLHLDLIIPQAQVAHGRNQPMVLIPTIVNWRSVATTERSEESEVKRAK